MERVALIDYGSGNLRSAEKALYAAAAQAGSDAEIRTTADPAYIARADRIVLPGVGAFSACMDALEARSGVIGAMGEAALKRGAPFLGICVGMQLLASRGLEFGERKGLDWIGGEVRKLTPTNPAAKIPHMGWNTLSVPGNSPLFAPADGQHMYFTHSFAFYPDEAGATAATTDHDGVFTAAVVKDNLAGVQFHPEKSQAAGLALIGRFLEWKP